MGERIRESINLSFFVSALSRTMTGEMFVAGANYVDSLCLDL